MKFFYKTLLVAVAAIVSSCTTDAEDESDSFDAAKVCPESGRGTFTDDRDGQVYKYTTIGNQVWMAENLKYDAEYSLCLDSAEDTRDSWHVVWINDFCDIFGRFYSLQKDGSYSEERDDAFVKNVCPAGWHLPSVDEWMRLADVAGLKNLENASTRLKNPEYWNFYKTGTDVCDFSANPAGAYMGEKLGLTYFESEAIFGTSTVDESGKIQSIKIAKDVTVFNNLPKMSIRCVKE